MRQTATMLQIPGPQGMLEAKMNRVGETERGLIVLCHPHPAYGGNLNDRILETLANQAIQYGYATLAFNVAGVGASVGQTESAAMAAADLAAVVAYVSDSKGSMPKLLGYSFGAIVVSEYLSAQQNLEALLIAPVLALGSKRLSDKARLSGQVIVGSEDAFAQPKTLSARFEPSSVQLIEGADHFFNGYDEALTKAAEPFFNGT